MFVPPFKVLKTHLVDAFFITTEKLYREFEGVIKTVDRFKNGRIYFIARRKKVRFKSARINRACQLEFKFAEQSNMSFAHKVPVSVLIHGSTDVSKVHFPRPENLQVHMHFVESEQVYKKILATHPNAVGLLPADGSINRDDRAFTYHLLLPIDPVPSDKNRHSIFAHQLLRLLAIDEGQYEILYIGKAMELADRTDGHSYIQQALAECPGDKEIFLYFFTPMYEALASRDGFVLAKPKDYRKLGEDKLVLITEAALINYFSPEFNIHHKVGDIKKSKTLLSLKALGYTHLISECIFDEYDYAFETAKVSKEKSHVKIFDLI
ncbi:hypothetical protein LOY64_11900 [Pseudomonas corrugata]|uniref:hypothetical protein n=1 Tax=Pseudomonas corrugata TaxID=47879 RepID=UPI00222E06D6|nr:hypothetical protein [Pseudomonas corrugata]UZD97663.1 hypothetical protein LOY64_11900 [Pseudomonas corrugata]